MLHLYGSQIYYAGNFILAAANRRSSSAIVLERGFGQDPSERAKLAMEEFHNDVDSWEDSRRGSFLFSLSTYGIALIPYFKLVTID